MILDITEQFKTAASQAGNWTHSDVERLAMNIVEYHPGARVDWEPGDEEWARVLEPGSDEPIALICARVPFGFIQAPKLKSKYLVGFVWIVVSSTNSASFKVDPRVLDEIFGRTVSRNLNYDTVSADEIWWATVS